MHFHSMGHPRSIAEQHFVAVYHPKDGRIVHLHMVHVLEGGRKVTRAQAEEEAKTHAKACGHNLKNLRLLYADKIPPGEHYKVDLASRSLVAVERQTMRRRRRAGARR